MFRTLFALALVAPAVASAADDTFHPPGSREAAPTAQSISPTAAPTVARPNHLYMSLRAAAGAPMDARGLAAGGSFSVGGELVERHMLGLRLSGFYAPEMPVSAPAGALGTQLEYAYVIPVIDGFDLTPGVAAGLAVGPDRDSGYNQVVPMFDVSLGGRFRTPARSGEWTYTADVGWNLFAMSPTLGLAIGRRF